MLSMRSARQIAESICNPHGNYSEDLPLISDGLFLSTLRDFSTQ